MQKSACTSRQFELLPTSQNLIPKIWSSSKSTNSPLFERGRASDYIFRRIIHRGPKLERLWRSGFWAGYLLERLWIGSEKCMADLFSDNDYPCMGQRQALYRCWSSNTAWAASSAELVKEDDPSCCVDYLRSRRGDDGYSRREVRECASACSPITARKKQKTDHITLGEREECGVTLRKNSGKLLVRMTRLLWFLLRNRHEISTADLAVWTYVLLRVQQHCTIAVVFYNTNYTNHMAVSLTANR